MSNNKLHDKRVKEIISSPGIIGLDNIVLSTTEANIFSSVFREKGSLIGQPDGLMFDPTTKSLYQLEYKCGDNRDRALYQLARNGALLQSFFGGWDVVDVYVHGKDFNTEMRTYLGGSGRSFNLGGKR